MEKYIKVLDMIADDMANDAAKFDGQPFNGRTVAEYFGNQGAAIASLARIVKYVIEVKKPNNITFSDSTTAQIRGKGGL